MGNICCWHKLFLNKIRNIFCVLDTKFVSATNVALAGKRGNICVGNNVSATMCPRLLGPLEKPVEEAELLMLCLRRKWGPGYFSLTCHSPKLKPRLLNFHHKRAYKLGRRNCCVFYFKFQNIFRARAFCDHLIFSTSAKFQKNIFCDLNRAVKVNMADLHPMICRRITSNLAHC